jgi:hypothetical protein
MLLSFFLFQQGEIKGQESEISTNRNLIYLELGGPGIMYSVNYDYKLKDNFSLRAGISSWAFNSLIFLIDGRISFTGIPLMVNYLNGKHDNQLEFGLGLMPAVFSVEGNYIFFGLEINERKIDFSSRHISLSISA